MVYDNNWNNRQHEITVLAGQESQEQSSVFNKSITRGFNETLQTIAAIDYATLNTTGVTNPVMPMSGNRSTLVNNVFRETETRLRFTSYYGNLAYTYDQRYNFNASWRVDKSSLFGLDKGAQNKPVWSTGAKWLLSNESFMKTNSWLQQLALRATYGITGNAPLPGIAASQDILQAERNALSPGMTALTINMPANKKLTWEDTKTVNIGIDFTIVNRRISGSIDLYRKKTSNLLGNTIVNGFTGYSSVHGNVGDMLNKGAELSLQSLNIQTRDFSWSSQLVLSYNRNTVTRISGLTSTLTGASKVGQTLLNGYPAFSLFAYKFAGLDNMGDPLIQLADKTVTKARNVATENDILQMGVYQPVWNGGFSNNFRYKGFSLAANMVYNLGHVMRREMNKFYTGRLAHNNVSNVLASGWAIVSVTEEFAHRWKQAGDEAFTNVPSYVASTSVSGSRRTITYYTSGDIHVLSASYIKMRDITLFYTLPKNILQLVKTNDITFHFQLSNLMLWKANKDNIDPEFNNASSGTRTIPVNQRTVTFGARIGF